MFLSIVKRMNVLGKWLLFSEKVKDLQITGTKSTANGEGIVRAREALASSKNLRERSARFQTLAAASREWEKARFQRVAAASREWETARGTAPAPDSP
jgi:hypothetical protein